MSLPDNDSEAEAKPPDSDSTGAKVMVKRGSRNEGGGRGRYGSENARCEYGESERAEHTQPCL